MARQLERFTAETVRQELGGRRAQADDFGGEVTQSLGALGATGVKVSAQYIEQFEETDARDRLVEIAKHRAEFAKRTDDALLTGEDLGRIEEDFNNGLADIRGNAKTRKGLAFADQHGAVSTANFQEQVRQISARRSGAELTHSVESVLTSASAALQKNPDLLWVYQGLLDGVFQTMEGKKLPPDVLANARKSADERLVYAGVNAEIEKNPHLTLQRLQEGEFETLKPEQRTAAINKAQTDINALEARRHNADVDAQRRQRAVDGQALGEVMSMWGREEPIDVKQLAQRADVSGAMREHLVNLVNRLYKEPKEKKNHEFAETTFRQIFAPEGTPGRVEDQQQLETMLFEGKIDPKEFTGLSNALARREKPYEKAIAKIVVDSRRAIMAPNAFGLPAPNGVAALNAFRADLYQTVDELKKSGAPMHEYINPASPKYLGNMAQQYVTLAQQRVAQDAQQIRDAAAAARAQPAPTPGETSASAPPRAGTVAKPRVTPEAKSEALGRPLPGFNVYRSEGSRWIYYAGTEEEFLKLPSGTAARLPDGSVRVRP